MKRTVNLDRLRSILRSNTNSPYGSIAGDAEGDFSIYLTNGDSYEVREGYWLNWSKDKKLIIEERSQSASKNMKKKIDESEGFFGTIFGIIEGVAENMGDSALSDTVEIKWKKIRDIESL